MCIGILTKQEGCGDQTSDVSFSLENALDTTPVHSFTFRATLIRWSINPLYVPSVVYIQLGDATIMVGKKEVDKAAKGLNALIDEFTSSLKELVNAG